MDIDHGRAAKLSQTTSQNIEVHVSMVEDQSLTLTGDRSVDHSHHHLHHLHPVSVLGAVVDKVRYSGGWLISAAIVQTPGSLSHPLIQANQLHSAHCTDATKTRHLWDFNKDKCPVDISQPVWINIANTWRDYIPWYRSQTNHLLVIVVGVIVVVVVVVVVVVPASPLYSPGGEAKPGGGPWDCQPTIVGGSTSQIAASRGQKTNMLLPDVAHHPTAAPQLAAWMIKVAVADGRHLVVGGVDEPAGGDRPGKTHSHCLRLLEVGA